MYASLIKKAQKDCYGSKFNTKVNNSKYIWNQINELFNYKRNKTGINIDKIIVNNNIVSDKINI